MSAKHTKHRWRILSRCTACSAPLLFGCTHDGRTPERLANGNIKYHRYSCIVTQTVKRHKCPIGKMLPEGTFLVREARRIFAEYL